MSFCLGLNYCRYSEALLLLGPKIDNVAHVSNDAHMHGPLVYQSHVKDNSEPPDLIK